MRQVRASSIRTFFDNPRIWLDTLEGKIKRTGSQSMLIGSLTHKAIEDGNTNGLDALYDELLLSDSYTLTDDKKTIIETAQAMFTAWAAYEPKPEIISREQRLSYLANDDTEVTGQYDALTADALIDFKTGARTISNADSHKYQLSIYAHLLQKCNDVTITKGIIYHIAQPTTKGVVNIKCFELDIDPAMGEKLVNAMLRRLWLYDRLPKKDREALFPPNPFSFIQEEGAA